MPLVSIIVPVYNVAPYLDRCVQSIVCQDHENLEILLIDDGSKDGSGEICENWALKDDRVKVIHQENQGLSFTRNRGIESTQGVYLSFVDADDYLSPHFISHLLEALISNEANMAVGNFYFVSENSRKAVIAAALKDLLRNGKEATEDLLYQRNLEASSCGRLYRRECIGDIRFPEGRIFEDLGTTYRFTLNAKRVVYCSEPLYYYVYRRSSISSKAFSPKKMDAIDMAESLYKGVCAKAPELEKAAACRLLSMCFHILFQTPRGSSYENEIFDLIKRHRQKVFFDGKARKVTRFMALMSYGGPRFLRLIYQLNQSFRVYAGRESHR